MSPDLDFLPPDACPASAVIVAARLAKTPLAILEAGSVDGRLLFANDAFADLLGRAADSLAGKPLSELGRLASPDVAVPGTSRFEASLDDGKTWAAFALSIAAVPGPDGGPLCLLCSMIAAPASEADDAPSRDAELLADVARAAGDLMKESGAAARRVGARHPATAASSIALDAVDRATRPAQEGRA